MTGKKKKKKNWTKPKKSEGRQWTKGRRKEKSTGRKKHAETDEQRQQDKKPHHLLLYLTDLISGQKYKTNNKKRKEKKNKTKGKKTKKTKDKKQWVTLQHKNTVQSMRLAQQMGVGAVTRLTNGNCVPWYWLQHTSCKALCPTTAAYCYYNLSYDLQRNCLRIPNFHGFACITGQKERYEKSANLLSNLILTTLCWDSALCLNP